MSSTLLHQAQMRALPLFQGIENDLLDGLMTSARFVEHDKGHIFLEEAKPVTRFYVVLEGWCGAVKISSSGQASILQIFRGGDFLPEPVGLTTVLHNSVNLQALAKLNLAMLTPNLVRNGLERSKIFANNMQAALTQRCNDLRSHIEQLTLRTAEERVGRFMLDMRLMGPQISNDIKLPFDKSILAAYLDIKPETLSRVLLSFKENGFKIDRAHVHMPDAQALCDYCDPAAMQQCHAANTDACPEESHVPARETH